MKNFSKARRILCSSLMIGFLLTVGFSQTPLSGGTYSIDFNTEAFDLSGGNANCNGQTYTFGPTGAGWEIANAEGITCGTTDDCGSYTSGNNDAQFETSLFDITCVEDVEIEIVFDVNDIMQDSDDCSTGPNGCGNDNLIFYYELDGGGPVQFANPSLCAPGNFTELSSTLNGSTLKVIVEGGTQANDEIITIEDIIFNSVAGPAPDNDICDADNEVLAGSTSGNTNAGYTNDCATMDGFSSCVGPIDEASVWFEYTNPGNVSSVTLSFASQGIGAAAWEVYDACGGVSIQDECDASNDLVFNVCNVTTPFLIQVSSASAEIGDFDIIVTEFLGPTPDLVKGTDITIEEFGANNGLNDCIVCVDDLFEFTALDPNDPEDGTYSYDWTDNGGNTYSGDMISIPVAIIADHSGTWTLIATDGAGCTAESTFDMTVNDLPTPANPTITAACENGNLILEFGGPETILDWEGPSGLIGSTADPITITNNAQTGTDDGTYWVIVSDVNGCSNSADVNVTLNPPPIVNITTDLMPICPGIPLNLSEDGGGTIDTWLWTTDGGGSFDDDAAQNTFITGMMDGDNLFVLVTDDLGCTAEATIVVSLLSPPSNDACGGADPIASSGLTNECSTADDPLGSCGSPQQDATVWYNYTIAAQVSSLTLSFTPGTITGAGWAVYDACGGTLLGEDCAGQDIILDCPPVGDIFIQVGSDPTTTGDFGIDIIETPAVANDTCDDPIAATPTVLCEAQPFSGITAGACPEVPGGPASCTQTSDPTIWFEFTADPLATAIEFTNVSGDFQILSGGCPANTGESGCFSGDFNFTTVTPGNTYLISGTDSGGAGSVGFEIAMIAAPANDLCADAIPADNGTNACATSDPLLCSDNDHVVYYTYTTINDGGTITITATPDGASAPVVDAWIDCSGTQFDDTMPCGPTVMLTCVPAGTMLTIPVGSATGEDGTFNLDITDVPGGGVANDLCDNADPIAILNPCEAVPASSTTVDACPENFAGGCTQMTDATVWFTFTTLANTTMADFTNVMGEFQLFTDCVGTTSGGCITADGAVPVTGGGTQYWVSGTVNGGEGDVSFEIALLEAPTNDACGAAEMTTGMSSGSTACASADATFCGASGDHVVYYTYTVAGPGAVTVQIDVTAGDATDIAMEAWADCGGTDFDVTQADCGATIMLPCVSAGTVLTIPVGSADGGEGTFDLAITETPGTVPNDDCSVAELVTVLVPCEPVPIAGSTVDACPEGFTSACTQDTDPTVWYTFTTLGQTTSIDFTNVNGAFELFSDCPVTTSASPCITADQGVGATANTTYWMSATVPGDEGGFSVDIAFLEAPVNDLCADAIGAGAAPTTGDNNCASADPTLCGGTDHVVYYTYTVVGPGTVTLDVTVSAGTAVDLSFALQNGCGGDIIDESCNADGTLSADCIPEGTEIIIPIGTADGNTGDFEVSVMEIPGGTGVANDECSDAIVFTALECESIPIMGSTTDACPELFTNCALNEDPTVWYQIDLPAGATSGFFEGLSSGTNIGVLDGCGTGASIYGCVTGDMTINGLSGSIWVAVSISGGEGSFSFDFTALIPPANDLCDDATDGSGSGTTCCAGAEGVGCGDTNTVWHQFTPTDPNATVVITVTNVSISGTMGVGTFTGADCSSLVAEDPCLGGTPIERTVSCLDGDAVWVQISSGADDCGMYDISFVEQSSDCDLGSECGSDLALTPSTNGAAACLDACNIGVCNEDCGMATIWFEVTTDDLASGMLLEVTSEFTPTIVMLFDACDGDVVIPCGAAASANSAVQASSTYYVGVGIASGDPDDFTLCVTTVLEFANCSVGELVITRPEYPGEDVNGPYCPGEKVEFCYTVDFNVDPIGSGNNCQWLQGIVPSIGGGWDQSVCPIEDQGPGGSSWFADNEVNYQISQSIYGLSTNCAGDPILTSSIGGGLGIGTPLPGGWYFTTAGGTGCDNNGNPNTMWGLNAPCGGSSTVEFCFELAANNPSDITECTDPCFSDMTVSMFVFADGQTGCWSQNSCAADTPTEFLEGSLDCGTLIFVEGPTEDEICSGDQLDLAYTAADGSSDILLEICEIGPNITGASDGVVFSGGAAQITDVLENTGTDPEIVIYCLSAVPLAGSICNGPKLEVEVTVYPEIMIEFDEPYNICFDGQEEIIPMPMGGSGNYVMYEWSNGETTPTVQAPLTIGSEPPGTYQYTLTVTDDLGCSGVATVDYIIRPEVIHMLNATADFACLDGDDDLAEICAIINAGQDNEPFTYDWIYDSDLVASADGFCLIIDDENSATGFYEIFVEITDEYGCVYIEGPIFFSVEDGPDVQQDTPFCIPTGGGDVEYSFEVCDDNGGTAEWSLFDETCSIQLDGPFSGNCVTFFVTPFAPGDDIPVIYCVQAIDLATNCVEFEPVEIVPPAIPDIPEIVQGCSGNTGTITLGNPDDFETWTWCDGVTQDDETYTFTFDEDDTCFLSVFDLLNGCEITYQIEIDVSDGATVDIEGSLSFCSAPGAFTTLCATPNDPSFEYLWSTGEITQCIDVSTAGPVNVEVNLGTCIAFDDVMVEVSDNLTPIINGGDVCTGSSVLLTTGQTFTTYTWTDAGGNTINPTSPATPWEIEVTAGGTYAVNVSDASCDGSGMLLVNESTPPTADIMSASPCNTAENGNITTLDLATLVTNATGAVSFLNPSGAPIGVTTIDYDGLLEGTLIYTAVIEGQDPCDDTEYDLIINVIDCGCPSLELFNIGNFCTNSSSDVPLFSFLGQNVDQDGTFTVEDADGNPAGIQPDATGQLTIDMTTAPGTYTLVYTFNNPVAGCDDFTSITFTVDAPPTPVIVTPDPLCNSDATGGNTMIDLETLVSGAIGFWKDDAGVQLASTIIDFNGQPTGQVTYFFETTDAIGECNNISPSVTISVIDCDCPVIGLSPLPGPLCQTDDAVNIGSFLITGTEAGQWSVTDPNGDAYTLGTGSSFDPEGLEGGIYTFTYTLSGTVPATCIGFVTDSIEVIEQLQGVVLDAVSVCGSDLNPIFPTVIDLTAIPELAGFSGSWSAPGNFNGGVIDDETAVDFTGVLPSDIIFTFTTDNAVAPCENLNINLVVNVANCDCPIVILTDTEVCNNDGLIDLDGQLNPASAPGTFSYLSGPESNVTLNGTEFDANGVDGGDYLFIYTIDPGSLLPGCPETDSLYITVSEPSTIDLGDDLTACGIQSMQGESILNLDELTGGVQGSWTPPSNYPDAIPSYESVSFLGLPTNESYTFTFTGLANGSCDGPTDEITITVIDCDCPNLLLNGDEALCNDNGTIDITQFLTQNIVDGTLSIEDAQGNPVTTNGDIFEASGLDEGEYLVIFTPDVAPPAECALDTAYILVLAPPTAGDPAAPAMFCEEDGDVVTLADLLDGESTGGSWQETSDNPSSNVAFDDTDGTFNTDGQTPGVYTFEYFFDTSNSPCDPVQETVVVEIEATPNADAGPGGTIDCDNNSITLGGSGSSTGAEFEYSWLNEAGETIYQGDELEYEVMSGGDFTLVVTNTLTGCSESSSALVETDEAFPSFSLAQEDISCFGFADGSLTLNDSITGTPPYVFLLNGPDANNLPPVGQSWFDLGPGNYTISLVDGIGCETSQSAIIVEPAEMSVEIGNDDFQLAIGDTVNLNVTNLLDMSMVQSITWTQDGEVLCEGTTADGTIDNCIPLPVEPPLIPTEYCLIVTTAEGCILVDCRTLQAQDVRDVYFPTVITDFDGDVEANTTFYVHTDEFVVSIPSFAIYDRWGELIHSYEGGFPNDPAWGWNGYFNGEQAAQGVYVYIIELEYGNGDTEIFTGSITVTR